MTPDQELSRGREADHVLRSPVYVEAYTQIEANIIAKMAQQATKAEEAEDLRRLLIALRKVKGYMEQVMKTGVMVEMQEKKPNWVESLRRFAA